MKPSEVKEIQKIIQAMGEIYNKQISEVAASLFFADIERFDAADVKKALTKCRLELRYFPTLSDIVSRIPDGRPSPDEALSMLPASEDDSVVWTEEMKKAFFQTASLLAENYSHGARSFKEIYTALILAARQTNTKPVWETSLGFDKSKRTKCLLLAVEKGYILLDDAEKMGLEEIKIKHKFKIEYIPKEISK